MRSPPSQPALHLRSYRGHSAPHDHDFAQLVLPVSGALDLDFGDRAAALDAARGAFVPTRQPHATRTQGPNRSLILDLPEDDSALAPLLAQLAQRPFLALSAPATRLLDFMALRVEQGQASAPVVQLWVPLLLDTLLLQPPRPASRLAALRARVQADPGAPWTVERMARLAALSPSRLHALFQAELHSTPRAWLQAQRLARARELLAHTRLPIAEIASRCGFADQSALTHAMRRAHDTTPAAWRRHNAGPAPA
ncbi:AraC family transcriptional regulator [Xenophilus arseniciresistens]|uniref:AraC family transcriptional regulator n=1 Tax=Xenophilus arseniciresistens TaxID=1283306 RepID=A0AAE3NDH9_9BURK|nr:AraC family transcriptional regulator [Xenophilus arseniciresistens]MDA7418841.1 AraC family transcriptional regulator [Xenophilus arseniciresistens]